MSTEEQKTAVTNDAGTVEPTPAPTDTVAADKPVEPKTEAKTEETPEKEGQPAAPAEEEKKNKKKEEEEEKFEPIYSGVLGYKALGWKK